MTRAFEGAELERIAAIVTAETGLEVERGGTTRLERAVRDHVSELGVEPDVYIRAIERDATARDGLVERLVIGETYFFREPGHFEFLQQVVLPQALERRQGGRARLWSAACATGEEVYSLALLVDEMGLADRVDVVGSDVSEAFLSKAREGVYRDWSLRSPEGGRALRLMAEWDQRSRLLDARIRKRVRLARQNLLQGGWEPKGLVDFDAVLCRNVLIYMDRPAVMAVARSLTGALCDGGWLITSATDPPLLDVEGLVQERFPQGLFYRRGVEVASAAGWSAEPPVVRRAGGGSWWRRRVARPTPLTSPRSEPDMAVALVAAQAAMEEGDYAHAAALMAEHDAEDAVELRVQALCELDLQAADTACRVALIRWPLSVRMRLMHALVLLAQERNEEALSAARRASCIDPSNAVAQTLVGMLRGRGPEVAGDLAIRQDGAGAAEGASSGDDLRQFMLKRPARRRSDP